MNKKLYVGFILIFLLFLPVSINSNIPSHILIISVIKKKFMNRVSIVIEKLYSQLIL